MPRGENCFSKLGRIPSSETDASAENINEESQGTGKHISLLQIKLLQCGFGDSFLHVLFLGTTVRMSEGTVALKTLWK
jgi:hypothetical protein